MCGGTLFKNPSKLFRCCPSDHQQCCQKSLFRIGWQWEKKFPARGWWFFDSSSSLNVQECHIRWTQKNQQLLQKTIQTKLSLPYLTSMMMTRDDFNLLSKIFFFFVLQCLVWTPLIQRKEWSVNFSLAIIQEVTVKNIIKSSHKRILNTYQTFAVVENHGGNSYKMALSQKSSLMCSRIHTSIFVIKMH